jgi:hypothetical protein
MNTFFGKCILNLRFSIQFIKITLGEDIWSEPVLFGISGASKFLTTKGVEPLAKDGACIDSSGDAAE